jgi:tripartite-type tricarboxylate transporter receptor subunit TctC
MPRTTKLGMFMSAAASAATMLLLAGGTAAQGYPDKPVKIIVPYGPGGNTDGIARIVGQYLSESFGKQFIVENRAGASGTIAVDAVARAPADGYMLLLTSLPQMAIVPAMMKVKYDPLKDLAPISNIGANPFILTVNPNLPIKSVADLVAYAKERGGKLNYASGGQGSHMNLTMQLFLKRAAIDITPVHLRGGAEPMNNVIAGHVPIGFMNASDVVQQASAGKVRALAVSTRTRIPQMPDLPTMIEAGIKDFEVVSWNGMSAPAGTPNEIIDKLAAGIKAATRDQKVAARLNALGVTPNGNSPAEFAADFKSAIALWGDVVRSIGMGRKE